MKRRSICQPAASKQAVERGGTGEGGRTEQDRMWKLTVQVEQVVVVGLAGQLLGVLGRLLERLVGRHGDGGGGWGR